MKTCPITYQFITEGKYASSGLHKISRTLSDLCDLNMTAEEQRREAEARSTKMSVQGVQPKLSAIFNLKEKTFEIVDTGGIYILKTQSHIYPNLPENEDLTMKLAPTVNIVTPFHGLIYAKDGSLTYFVRRFDRPSTKKKLAVEDFSQLLGRSRDTKYNSSMEQVAEVIEQHCTFPVVEKLKLFQRTLFCYLTGNEDMHLKNFSLITRDDKVELAPAYDLVNTTLAVTRSKEELALPLRGKKRNLNRNDFVRYFGSERLGISEKAITEVLTTFQKATPLWDEVIERSFLPPLKKEMYKKLLKSRATALLI